MIPSSLPLNKKVIAGALILLVVAAIAVIAMANSDRSNHQATTTAAAEKVISRRIGNSDFRIVNTLVDSDGWQLVRIEPLSDSGGEGGFVVLQQEGDVVTLKAGPGTYLSDSNLRSTGVPREVQSEMSKALRRR